MPAIPAMPEFSAHQRKHLVNFVHRLFNLLFFPSPKSHVQSAQTATSTVTCDRSG